jgi:glycerophosphoryl diester phosphodiesterase
MNKRLKIFVKDINMKILKKKFYFILPAVAASLLILFINSCSNDLDVLFPQWDNTPATVALTSDQKTRMEGIYNVEAGSDQFGGNVILQWNGDYLTVYTGKNTGYFLLQGGQLDATIYVQGLWRYQNNAETGLSQFTMTQGADYVLNNNDSTSIVLTGTWGDGQGTPTNSVVFKYVRPIKPELLQNKYYIISHHGSGGGPEYLPHTENTVEIAKIIERYGCNGIEIDVRISKDGVPFMYHDNTLNPRLVRKGSLVGTVESYTYKELQSFVVLFNGERIPTLDAILTAIVQDTQLEFVYVDCKPSAINGLGTIATVCQDARDLAETIPGRAPIHIYMAMTTDDLVTAFQDVPNFREIPTICELSIDDLNTLNSQVWSPRFTEGTQNAEVEQLHSQGKLAITWTVNLPALTRQYLTEGIFDGMLTDYPTELAYYYYGQ